MSIDWAGAVEIAVALARQRLGLFVGAGISARLGFPGWWTLVAELFEATGGPAARATFETGGGDLLLRVDQILASHAQTVADVLRTRFAIGPAQRAAIAEDPVYRFIVRAGFPIVVTTNYDRSIEVAFEIHGKQARTVDWSDGVAVSAALHEHGDPQAPFVLHLHGVDTEAERIVLAERAYRRRYFTDRSERARLDLALARSWLFMGFSFDDADFRAALRERTAVFEESRPRHFAIFPAREDRQQEEARSVEMLGRFSVRPVTFAVNRRADGSLDFGALAELTEAISEEVERALGQDLRPIDPADPNKGQFGGHAAAGGYVLEASPVEYTPLTCTLILRVVGPAAAKVRFHLHPTFRRRVLERPCTDGEAVQRLVAWGAFTVGAEVLGADGVVLARLEHDLAQDERFDAWWRSR